MNIYGLQCKRDPHGTDSYCVDLESTRAKVVVKGFVADLSITLVYINKCGRPLEVAYVCPVDAKAAIYHFEAKLQGRTIIAHCLEKKKAQEAYEAAVKKGHTAILGSEDECAGDIFHLSLGNIPEGQTVELSLKIVLELPVNVDGSVTFTLPTIFNPRYCPADQQPGPTYPRSGSVEKVFPNRTPYSLEIEGEVRGSFKIANITSQTDPINFQISDEDTTALITQDRGSKFDHDWSFQVYYQTVHKAHALQMAGDRTSTRLMKDDILMLNLFPEIPVESFSPHNEVIFVVDRSGSMDGKRIANAKTTLLLFLKSLPPGCRFNVVSFGSSHSSLFEISSERYTEDTLKKALHLQKSMKADMGGTEILEVLKSVYSKDLIPGYARQMIVLTDGEVWIQKEIFDLISRHVDGTRVFGVGIGEGASTALIQGIAAAGRGRYEMVYHEKHLQTKVMGLVASMLQENVQDLNISCEVEPLQELLLVPKISPVIFGGQHLILYARVTPKSKINSIKISWTINENKIECEIGGNDCKIIHDSNFSFHRLAAKAQLSQWQREDFERSHDDLVSLSIASNVVCNATSFIGIDQDGKCIKPDTQSDDSYVECDSDDYGCDNNISFQKYSYSSSALAMPSTLLMGRQLCSNFDDEEEDEEDEDDEEEDEEDEGEKEAESDMDEFFTIVSSQNFDGSWNLSESLQFIKKSEKEMNKIKKELGLDDICFATTLVLALLQLEFASRKQEWLLMFNKAKIFLTNKNVEVDHVIKTMTEHLNE